jgi:uncharacterized RDD family membrane protein YckC
VNGASGRRTPVDSALPPGLRVAGIRVRVGAWLIDGLILAAFQIGFWAFAAGVGALAVDPEAERQMTVAPLSLPTVAPYRVNLPLLAVLLAAFVLMYVVYAAVCWARFRATPGQKALSLQVGSAASGRNLSLYRALVRAVVVVGVQIGAVAGILYAVFAFEATVPWSDVLNPQTGGPADLWVSRWSGLLLLALLGAVVWPALLLIWTATNPTRQGPHDQLAGSLVVGRDTRPLAARGLAPEKWVPGALPPGSTSDATTGAEGSVGPWAGSDSGAQPALQSVTIGRRVAAYLIDSVLVYLIYSLSAALLVSALLPGNVPTLDERTYILVGLVGGLEQLVYFVGGWALAQGSPGQRVLHVRVADATTGKSLTWMDGLVRWAVLQGPFALVTIVPNAVRLPVLAAAGAWSLYLLYTTMADPDQKGLHDRFLNSRVGLNV